MLTMRIVRFLVDPQAHCHRRCTPLELTQEWSRQVAVLFEFMHL